MIDFRNLREECLELNLRLYQSGLIDLTFGNASVIDRDQGLFAIKPSGVAYDQLRTQDIVVLDLDGVKVAGELRPSSDTPTHLHLLKSFRHTQAIIHTHSRHGTSFAQSGKSIPCLGTTHADYFYGPVPVTRDLQANEIATDYELNTGKVIVETFSRIDPSDMSAVLVRNHGVFVWGASCKKALENAVALELVAEMTWKALALNPHAPSLSQELLDRHYKRKHGPQSYYGQITEINAEPI